MQRTSHHNGRGTDVPHKSNDVLDELKNAFEFAEQTSPGISEIFVSEMVKKLVPSSNEARLKNLVDKMLR